MDNRIKLYFADETVTCLLSEMELSEQGNVRSYSAEVHGAKVTCSVETREEGSMITLSAKSELPLALRRMDSVVFDAAPSAPTDRILFFGNNMCHCTHRYPCELGEGVEYCADSTGLFPTLDGYGMALAAVVPFTNTVGAGVRREGDRLVFFAKTEFTEGRMNETELCSESFFLSHSISIQGLYGTYRSFLPESSFPMPRLTGWNTWDYYLDRVTPEDIFENIDALAGMPFADKLHYIVIDDGWQKNWGEWVENEKFACGLDTVADKIQKRGFLPGIWAAPLLMKESCEGFADRQHWFSRNEKGEWIRDEGNTCVIDPTIPEAHEFILDIYRRLYRQGFRLFKIDYLSPILRVKNFYDRNATPYSALRQLIRDVQAVTGSDAVILGCSLPVQCGADIAPAMRIGVDIHNHFTHVKWIAEMLSWTWMYNNKTTRIDADFLVVRGLETANEPLKWEGEPNYTAPKRACDMTDAELFHSRWRQGDQFNALEAETWANLVALTGGNIFLSDRMAALNEKGIEIIQKAFDAISEECIPEYLTDDERLPSLWKAEDKLLIVNWRDVPVTKQIDGAWENAASDKPYRLSKNVLSVDLLPHESILIHFR